jgi:hypothetical protein
MKILILSLSLILTSTCVFSQRKSKVDPKDAQIDTLTKVNKSLTVQLDSVSKELVKYVGVYSTIKEKVIHYNFDPTRAAYLIDSLKASRDSTAVLLGVVPKSTAAADSITALIKENAILKDSIANLKTAWAKDKASLTQEEIDKAKTINNLKQLKELLDNKIITEAEFIALKKKYLERL